MRRLFLLRCLALVLLVAQTTGCGGFVAHRILQAPNTYPTWCAPQAPVTLDYDPKFLTNFPRRYVDVGPPDIGLCYRIVNPAAYHLSVTTSNWLEAGKPRFQFSFDAIVPGPTNAWTAAPRGTVFLLHGYGLAQFSLAPWALRLAEGGWRCVLVDLRGHGRSGGKQVDFGLRETNDLSQLMDQLAHDGQLAPPAAVFGESYGAALALRWKTVEPRLQSVIAIAPFATFSNAVLNVCHDYASWLPDSFVNAGVRKVPAILGVSPGELDPTTVLERCPVTALFIAGENDTIAPPGEVRTLSNLAAPGSRLIVVPQATHEALTYYFDALSPPVLSWLDHSSIDPRKADSRQVKPSE